MKKKTIIQIIHKKEIKPKRKKKQRKKMNANIPQEQNIY